MIPSLYVHIPFCLSKCSYCTFVSSKYQEQQANSYLAALQNELALRNSCFTNLPPTTLFIGGGTPSCLTEKQLEKLCTILPFPTQNNEATCEMNPDTASKEKLSLLYSAGITRCSLGVQTFDPAGLRLLNRRHDAATALAKVEMAVNTGFASVNIDLITAWPGQTLKMLEYDLHTAANLGIHHISCYNLILEEKSRLHSVLKQQSLIEKPDDEVREFWDLTQTILAEYGFEQYETSNFAKPGFRCQHNIDTWKGKEYLGIGSAAHSHINGRRYANVAALQPYINACVQGKIPPEAFSEKLDCEQKARECATFWLRITEGIDCNDFMKRTGYDIFHLYRDLLPDLINQGILEIIANAEGGKMLRVASEFRPVLDAVLVDLV